MRASIALALFIIVLTACSDEPVADPPSGLRLSEPEVVQAQKAFVELMTAFKSVTAARESVPSDQQTDAGFIYLDVLEGTVTTGSWAVLGSLPGADIEALAFLVMMEAAKSAQEDLKAIMNGVKEATKEKKALREAASAWESQLSVYTKALGDVFNTATDLQQVPFTDTTITAAYVFGDRPASFARNGQDGSITEVSITSQYHQTPAMTFEVLDMTTGEVLHSETISQDFSYSNTWKKNTMLDYTLALESPDGEMVPVSVKIIHSRKVMKEPDVVNPAKSNVIRQLAETLAEEAEEMYDALQIAYNDGFISTAEGDAVNTLVTSTVNRFGYASNSAKDPRIFKYPRQQEAVGELGDSDMKVIEEFMRRKETGEERISEILKRMRETQDKIIDNLK